MSLTAAITQEEERLDKVRSEVERLLNCLDESADHYRVLGVRRDASIEDIREAYRTAVDNLHPLKCRDVIDADGTMHWKLSRAFMRVVEAFTTLSRPGRRIEYDGLLNRRPTAPLPIPALPDPLEKGCALESMSDRSPDEGTDRISLGTAFGHASSSIPKVADRRRVVRFALRLPVRVSASEGDWDEATESWDVSRLGIRIKLNRRVEVGDLLRLDLPMPGYLRTNSQVGEGYSVVGVVRYALEQDGDWYLVGIEFLPDANTLVPDALQ